MEVVEGPSFHDWPIRGSDELMALGEFVLLSIDPLASVAHLEDAVATEEASRLERVVYLALIVAPLETGLEVGESYKLAFSFFLVGQGLPDPAPAASCPVAPATEHPDARPPIEPNSALPWSNLYVHTLYNFQAIVSRFHPGSSPLGVRIEPMIKISLREDCYRDHARFKDHSPRIGHFEHVPTDHLLALQEIEGIDIDDLDSLSGLGRPQSIASESTAAGIRRKLGGTYTHVELWLDVNDSRRPQLLGDPKDFQHSLWAVKKIWQDWESRATTEMLAKRPATTNWLQGTAQADAPELRPLSGEPETIDNDDTSVGPEDAIEHRIERAEGPRLSDGRDTKGSSVVPPGSASPAGDQSQHPDGTSAAVKDRQCPSLVRRVLAVPHLGFAALAASFKRVFGRRNDMS